MLILLVGAASRDSISQRFVLCGPKLCWKREKGWERIIVAGDPIPVLLRLGMKMMQLLCGSVVVRNTQIISRRPHL